MKRIDVLHDDVLLVIFHFYVEMHPSYGSKMGVEAWRPLVHVCRRWRSLVFGSPHRLNLQLYCTPKTPTRDTLDVWPALPLVIEGSMTFTSGTDNVIVALEQSNRVCQVFLMDITDWQLEKVLAAMQVSFPELAELRLWSDGETLPVIPDSFLGGSAPRLEYFELSGIPFPGMPNLLLSANHLVYLNLYGIPHSAYISPETVVALLTLLSSLETLSLEFRSPQSRPDLERRTLPPPNRSILAVLRRLDFKGVSEYLEDFVTCIDTPQLEEMDITFFNQIDFDCPRLAQFINCTPTLRTLDEAHVQFDYNAVSVKLRYWTSFDNLVISISNREPDWQLSSVEQLCNSSLHPLSTVEDLYIERRLGYSQQVWMHDATESILWLELLIPFTAVENLYLSEEFAPGIAVALRELVAGRTTEVLPSLQNIFVQGLEPSGSFQKNTEQFVATRLLFDHPITISDWDKDDDRDI